MTTKWYGFTEVYAYRDAYMEFQGMLHCVAELAITVLSVQEGLEHDC